MIRYRTVLAAALLVVVGSGCGVGVDAAPRPLEPITGFPLQPAPTVVELPDDRSARCLSGSVLPTSAEPSPSPAPDVPPSTPPSAVPSC